MDDGRLADTIEIAAARREHGSSFGGGTILAKGPPSESRSSHHDQSSTGMIRMPSSRLSGESARAAPYQDGPSVDADGKFKTQQRIRTLQLELAEKQ